MAVSTTTLSIRYLGNDSTEIAYEIPFPFLDASHIYAARVDAEPLGTLAGSQAAGIDFTDWEIALTYGATLPEVGAIIEDARHERARITNVIHLGGATYQLRTANSEAFAPTENEAISYTVTTLLNPDEYNVTRATAGTGGTLTTKAKVTDPSRLIIFRSVPLTQPTVFQPAGPFPAKSNETALDRLLMQVQQLNRRINEITGFRDYDYVEVPSSDPNAARDVATWATPSLRGTIKPGWAGQLGVERSTGTVWIARSAATGDWDEFRPVRRNQLVIGVTADAGVPGAPQTAIANLFASWNCDAVLFAGDNNYNGTPGYDNDWAAFFPFINDAKAFPALGNHDLDSANWQALLDTKFDYLPGNRRYYSVVLGGGLVELFVLNSGLNTELDLVEVDGNDIGSDQHAWFVTQLEASKARWKIAMFHHPPVTLVAGEDRTADAMDWPELAKVDLILCGHTHALEILKWRDTMLVNPSASVQPTRPFNAVFQGSETLTAYPLWANDETHGACRIVASQDRLEVEIWRTDGALLHARSHDDFTPRPCIHEQYQVIGPDTPIGTRTRAYVTTVAAPSMIRRVMLSVNLTGDVRLDWTLYAGTVVVANGTLMPDAASMMVASQIPLEILPRGTQLTMATSNFYGTPHPDASGLDLSLFLQRHN